FPGCDKLAVTNASSLCHDEADYRDLETFAYHGDRVLASLEAELMVLRSGDLAASLLSMGTVQEVLPNGMLLTTAEGDQELRGFHLEPRWIPVVAELDSEANRVKAVHHRQGGAWADVTAEVGWVELRFRLADY